MQFGSDFTGELEESHPVIIALAIEEPVQARLDPVDHRLEEESRDDNGQDPAAATEGGEICAEEVGGKGDQAEGDSHDRGGGERISDAAPEDDVHVHQTVSNNRIAKSERKEDQRQHRKVHPSGRNEAQRIRHRVKCCERNDGQKRPSRHPFELLLEQRGLGPAIAIQQENGPRQEVRRQINQLTGVQDPPHRERRQGHFQNPLRDQEVSREQQRSGHIDQRIHIRTAGEKCRAFRKTKAEMQEHRRLQYPGQDVEPIDGRIEQVQFPGVGQRVEREGSQTKDVEMKGLGRGPPADQNKSPDEEVQKPDDFKEVVERPRAVLRPDDYRGVKFFSAASKLVSRLGPHAARKDCVAGIRPMSDRQAVD